MKQADPADPAHPPHPEHPPAQQVHVELCNGNTALYFHRRHAKILHFWGSKLLNGDLGNLERVGFILVSFLNHKGVAQNWVCETEPWQLEQTKTRGLRQLVNLKPHPQSSCCCLSQLLGPPLERLE